MTEKKKPEGVSQPDPVIVPPVSKYEIEKDMGVFSTLIMAVDHDAMTMPQARKILGEWFYEQKDRPRIIAEGRPRMRRLKQIVDAMYEEWSSLAGQPQV